MNGAATSLILLREERFDLLISTVECSRLLGLFVALSAEFQSGFDKRSFFRIVDWRRHVGLLPHGIKPW